jgi:hypothetical protein
VENNIQSVENVENEKQCGKNPGDTILGVENVAEGMYCLGGGE